MTEQMIEIDPNVRIQDNNTFVFLDDVTGLSAGDAVVVWQPEMQMSWPASIVEIDQRSEGDWFVELSVRWNKHKEVTP